MTTPVSDYVETKGIVFFARMLDKLRLKEKGLLPPDYNYAGGPSPDCFDAYCCRFFNINAAELVDRVRAGGADEEILDWCFERFGQPNDAQIRAWNDFVVKCGWRDRSSVYLEEEKQAQGLGDRTDIKTWVDYHDVDEGRAPRSW